MTKKEKLIKLLDEEFKYLSDSVIYLKYSYVLCKKIGLKNKYSMQELSDFESLSGRFARTSDILTQKVIKTMFIILQEDAKFFIDRCNLLEKFQVIEKADDLYEIRMLRNDIAHDYCRVNITSIFEPLLEYTKQLLDIIDNTKSFVNSRILNL